MAPTGYSPTESDLPDGPDAITDREKAIVRRALDAVAASVAVCGVVRDATGQLTGLRVEHLNEAARRWLGIDDRDAIPAALDAALPSIGETAVRAQLQRVVDAGEPATVTGVTRAGRGPGDPLAGAPLDVHAARLGDGLLVSWSEIDAGRRSSSLSAELGRVYGVLSAASEAIVRAADERTLFDEICEIAVDCGGMRMAWIGRVEDSSRVVRPVSWAGAADGYIEDLWIPLDASKAAGRGPTATAVLSGKTVVVEDVEREPRMAPWRAAAASLGFRSTAAFPLRVRGERYGALNLYAAEPDAFSSHDRRLFEQLAAELGVAVEMLAVERERQAAEARYRELFEKAAEGIYVAAPDGRLLAVNPAMARMLGYESAAAMRDSGVLAQDLYGDPADRVAMLATLATGGEVTELELEMRRRDGRLIWVRLDAHASLTSDGSLRSVQALVIDISESRVARDTLLHHEMRLKAILDRTPAIVSLKDVGSRRYLLVNHGFERAYSVSAVQAVGATDEELLPDYAPALRDADEACLTVHDAHYEDEQLGRGAEQRTLHTVRFALLDAAGRPEAICRISTDITERRKHEQTMRDRLQWRERITSALREGRFVVHSQPIVDVHSGAVTQEELLIRMRSIESPPRLLTAAEFLPAAERLGLMLEIDRLVLAHALRLVRRGRRVQVNISAQSIGHPEIVADLERGIALGVEDPSLLIFELTETAAVEDTERAGAFSRAVAAAGCGLALDDFGTGYGAMTYLRLLPAQILKIDRSFVRDLSRSEDDRAIVRTIVAIARERGLTTIGEGVEDAAALTALRELGVDLAQGNLLGPPGPSE